MKKLISLLLALALCVGLTAPAMAAEGYGPVTVQIDDATISFTEATVEENGTLSYMGVDTGSSIITGTLITVRPGSAMTVTGTVKAFPFFLEKDGHYSEMPTMYYLVSDTGLTRFTGKLSNNGNPHAGQYAFHSWDDNDKEFIFVMGPDRLPSTEPKNPETPKESVTFSDVSTDAYFYAPVQWAIESGITNGTTPTTFSPDSTCTTAHILTFLYRAKGSQAVQSDASFSDVSSSDYFYYAARWAKENGLVEGDQFNGGSNCTRAAVVTYLWKLAGAPAVSGSQFADVPTDAAYAQAVAWAVENGITNGTSATAFSPNTTCTRGQIVTFLYRAYAE